MSTVSIYGAYNAADDFSEMRQEDLILSRLSLMQFGSQPVKDGKFAAGELVINSLDKVFSKRDGFGLVIPIGYFLEWVEWNPNRKEEKRILNRSVDPNSELAKMSSRRVKTKDDKGKEINRVNEAYTFTMLAPEFFGNYDEMVVYSFSKTGHSVGKGWLNRMRSLKNNGVQVPMAGGCWKLGTKIETKDGDDYLVPHIGEAMILDEAVVAATLPMAAKFREQREKMQEAAASSTEDEHAAAKGADDAPF